MKLKEIPIMIFAGLVLGILGGRWIEFLYYFVAKEKVSYIGVSISRALALLITASLALAFRAEFLLIHWAAGLAFALVLLTLNEYRIKKGEGGSIGDSFMQIHGLFLMYCLMYS